MKILSILFFCFALPACVSTNLSDTSDMQQYELRSPTHQEAKKMQGCLRALHTAEEKYEAKNHKYLFHADELNIDEPCSGLQVAVHHSADGYEAICQFHDDQDTSVRWTMNAYGEIHESGEVQINDDLDF